MAYLDDLIAAREAAAANLKAAMQTAGAAGNAPNSDASGVDHGEYVSRLLKVIADLDGKIATAQLESDGPWEHLSTGSP